jgi:hypothetical protein
MAMPALERYKARMIRLFAVPLLAVALSLGAPALADTGDAAAPKKKPAATRHVKKWTTPPGYRTPAQIEREQVKSWRRDREFAYRYNTPRGYYFYYGPQFYNGRFGANRRDTWHIGPCWTQTPIGAVWNCGN